MADEYTPNLVCFSCKFGWGYVSNDKPIEPGTPNWVPVVCSGKVDSIHILNAFKEGADGVLILGCEEGHCHFQDGNFQTSKKVYLLQKILKAYGIDQERVRIEFAKNPDGAKIPQVVGEMKRDLSKLGPLKRL
jgi:F420-non-reducing hydrogenase iron-sulfur subunit